MLRASIELFGIEWVGNRPLLVALAPLLGSLVVAVVAGYAARLAAKTANIRQQEQLSHDASRHREQLAHDRKRQRKELAHDRRMRKQEHTRDALDEAIELVSEVQDAVAETIGSAEWMEEQRDLLIRVIDEGMSYQGEIREQEKEVSDHELVLRNELLDATDKALGMFAAGVRLRLRLGYSHSIPVEYLALKDAWIEILDSLECVAEHNRDAQETADFKAAYEAAGARYASLMVEAENWFK